MRRRLAEAVEAFALPPDAAEHAAALDSRHRLWWLDDRTGDRKAGARLPRLPRGAQLARRREGSDVAAWTTTLRGGVAWNGWLRGRALLQTSAIGSTRG